MAILESQQEVATILVPPLLKLGLSSLLIKLLAFEMTKLKEDRTPERYNFVSFGIIWNNAFTVSLLPCYSSVVGTLYILCLKLCSQILCYQIINIIHAPRFIYAQ